MGPVRSGGEKGLSPPAGIRKCGYSDRNTLDTRCSTGKKILWYLKPQHFSGFLWHWEKMLLLSIMYVYNDVRLFCFYNGWEYSRVWISREMQTKWKSWNYSFIFQILFISLIQPISLWLRMRCAFPQSRTSSFIYLPHVYWAYELL